MLAPMPLRRARLEVLPGVPPEWRLLRELKDDVLKGHWADVSTRPPPAVGPKKGVLKSRASINYIAMDLNREMRQVLTMTDWPHLEAVLDPEEPTLDDRTRRSSFHEALVQVCEFLDGLVDPKLRHCRSPCPRSARRALSRFSNLESLYSSLRRPSQRIECLTKSVRVISIFSIKDCHKSKLERGLQVLQTFNNLVGDFQALDPLPLPLSGPMTGTIQYETLERFTYHATASLKAIFESLCSDKSAHNVLVELPTVADLTRTTSTLSLLISLCSIGNGLWQEAEVIEGTKEEGDGQFILTQDDACTNTFKLCNKIAEANVDHRRLRMSLLANSALVPSNYHDLLFYGTKPASVQDLFPDGAFKPEDVRISNSRKALAVGLALYILAYINPGWSFGMHAEEIYYRDSKTCDQHFFVRLCGEKEAADGLSAFDRIRARLISFADLLLAIEMGGYCGGHESADTQTAEWDILKRELAAKAAEGKEWASKESIDRIPYFNAVLACLLFERIVDVDINVSDEGYLDPCISTYVREKIVGNLLQSIETTRRRVDPSANRPPGARSAFLLGGSQGARSITAPTGQHEALQRQRHNISDVVFDGGTCNLAGEEISTSTDEWFRKLKDVHTNLNRDRMDELTEDEIEELVKVAVLDTGVDTTHEAFKMFKENGQLDAGYDFVDRGQLMTDLDGHGTHCCDLLFKTAPYAKVYPLRVFRSSAREDITPVLIKEAIYYAIETLDVDIISMSFAFEEEELAIKDALYNAKGKSLKPVLMFAAASNNRALHGVPIGYPARVNDRVICVNSSTVQDEKSSFSPHGILGWPNLSVIGENVLAAWPRSRSGPWKRMSGTSCATPIVAGVAALLLDFSKKDLPELKSQHGWNVRKDELWETLGMRSVLKRCLTDGNQGRMYNFLKPWKLLTESEQTIAVCIEEALKCKHIHG